MSTATRSIDVIVPTTGERTLTGLSEALSRQTQPARALIVIEDSERRGSAWARNRGIEQSRAELVAFLDDDCIPPPHWLASLADAIERHSAAGAGGTYEEEDPFLRARRRRQGYPDCEQIDRDGWVGAGGNIAYRRSALNELHQRDGHYFNEAFRISQDKELAWRMRLGGGALIFVPVTVRHTKHCTGWAYLRQQFGRGIGIAGLYWMARARRNDAAPDRGSLWPADRRGSLLKWLRIIVLKGIGPFDRRSFQRGADFLLFWTGEKIQGIGFLWGLMRRPFKQDAPSA